MSLREFIRTHRAEIDAAIVGASGLATNDEERREWILNDEGLYRWARAEGVRIVGEPISPGDCGGWRVYERVRVEPGDFEVAP